MACLENFSRYARNYPDKAKAQEAENGTEWQARGR
jgi:hypothetical protein